MRRSELRADPAKVQEWQRRSRVRPAPEKTPRSWRVGMASKTCAMCNGKPAYGHHVITKQQLKIKAAELRDPELAARLLTRILHDVRNRLPLCARCHADHHAFVRRVPRELVTMHCPKIDQFAGELGLEWWLDREYPIPKEGP